MARRKKPSLGKREKRRKRETEKESFCFASRIGFPGKKKVLFLARGERGGRGKRSLLTGPFLILLSQLGTRLSHTPRSPSFFSSFLLTPFIPLLLSSQDDKVKRG